SKSFAAQCRRSSTPRCSPRFSAFWTAGTPRPREAVRRSWLCSEPRRMRGFFRWFLDILTTPLGVIILAALDSTIVFFLPLGIDAVVIILSARRTAFAWTVPLLATAGSLGGAAA